MLPWEPGSFLDAVRVFNIASVEDRLNFGVDRTRFGFGSAGGGLEDLVYGGEDGGVDWLGAEDGPKYVLFTFCPPMQTDPTRDTLFWIFLARAHLARSSNVKT